MSVLSFKNTESEKAKEILMDIAEGLVTTKNISLEKATKMMTREKALQIKKLRQNHSYGALAETLSTLWSREEVFWIKYPSSQVVGCIMCTVAMKVLDQNDEEFEDDRKWFVQADHPTLGRPDKWTYSEKEKNDFIKELQDLGYVNIQERKEKL